MKRDEKYHKNGFYWSDNYWRMLRVSTHIFKCLKCLKPESLFRSFWLIISIYTVKHPSFYKLSSASGVRETGKTVFECIAALSSRSLFINIFKIFMNSFNKLLNHHFMSSYASGYNNGLLLGSQGLNHS